MHPVLSSLSVTTEIGKKVGNLHRFHMCLSMRLLVEESGLRFDLMADRYRDKAWAHVAECLQGKNSH